MPRDMSRHHLRGIETILNDWMFFLLLILRLLVVALETSRFTSVPHVYVAGTDVLYRSSYAIKYAFLHEKAGLTTGERIETSVRTDFLPGL
jgi:hypothetical protein